MMTDQQKVSILIVDDLPEKLLVYTSILEELDEEIVTARSGPEALKQVLQRNFAVILLDVNMPGMDGFETAMLIRSRSKSAHTPIIFLTSYYDDLRQHRGYAHGAVDYILAPVEPEILKAKVKVFVDLCRLHEQAERRAEERIALAEEKAKRLAAEQANRHSAFLAQASRVLANSLELDDTLNGLSRLAVPALAEVCSLCLQDESGHMIRTKWMQSGEDELDSGQAVSPCPLFPPLLQAAIQRVLNSGEAERIDRARTGEDPRQITPLAWSGLPWQSVLLLPLGVRDKKLGCMLLAATRKSWQSQSPEFLLAEDLAYRGAIALDNALLVRDIREADKRKDEFLAMLAHELRNPLAPIQNAVEILRLIHTTEPRIDRARDMIDRQIRHLTRLVEDLLDVSRITQGKIKLQVELVELSTASLNAIESSRSLIDGRQHRLMISLPNEPVIIKGDPARITQIICNLLNNAAKYSENQGVISLTLQREDKFASLRIRDTGEGIPRDMLSSIFEPFVQLHPTSERAHGGLGIGLTLVRRLVELHQGSVTACSEGKGQGSEFMVRLPLAQEEESSAIAESLALQTSNFVPKPILLLKDQQPILPHANATLPKVFVPAG
jgi:signal transduction histidine kinase/DNA-binding response OmpR family regulator